MIRTRPRKGEEIEGRRSAAPKRSRTQCDRLRSPTMPFTQPQVRDDRDGRRSPRSAMGGPESGLGHSAVANSP